MKKREAKGRNLTSHKRMSSTLYWRSSERYVRYVVADMTSNRVSLGWLVLAILDIMIYA